MTHRWADPIRPDRFVTLRTCIKCGIVKHTHHQDPEHWSEFRAQDGRLIETADGRTPACMPVKVAA